MAPSTTYIPPANDEMFRMGTLDLKATAEGRPSKRQKAAVAEQLRRKTNKTQKRGAAA